MSSSDESVRVCVRIRPLSNKEKQDGRNMCVPLRCKRWHFSRQRKLPIQLPLPC